MSHCKTSNHGHSCDHHHHEQSSCCSSHCKCPCHSHHGEEHEHSDFAQELLQMADEAWMELLKEKIKENIQTLSGSNLDQLAKLVAESNHERWKHMLADKKACNDYHEKVANFCHTE